MEAGVGHRQDERYSKMKPDLYYESAVLSFIDRPVIVLTGPDFKRFSLLGDRVAATILMNVQEPRLFEPVVVERIERILAMAFPNFEDDRRLSAMPYLSIFLVRKLLSNVEVGGPSHTRLSRVIERLQSIQSGFLERAVRWDEKMNPAQPE